MSVDHTAAPNLSNHSNDLNDENNFQASEKTLQPSDLDPESGKLEPEKSSPNGPNGPELGPPPDGGYKAWTTVLGGFCGLFVSFGWINCIGVFQTYYEENQLKNMSTSTVGWITSIETFVMFLPSPLMGILFDSYGPRWLLLGGTFLHVFGLMMTSLSTEYYQFILSQGICSPLGASAIFAASVNSVSTWFGKRRGAALGTMTAGSSLGGIIFPIMVSHLIPEVGFPWTMRICAFLMLGLLVISNVTIKSRLNHWRKPFHPKVFAKPLTDIKFVATVVPAFLFFWGMFLPFSFVITQAERYGMSSNLSQYLIPILNATSIFGRTLPGILADRFGRFNMMIVFSYFASILILALWLPSRGNAPAIVFSALYGFASGAFVSLLPTLIAEISDMREVGIRNGTAFAIISFAALTGTPIGGALVPDVLHGSYTPLQIFTGVTMIAGATLFVVARIIVGGAKLTTKI